MSCRRVPIPDDFVTDGSPHTLAKILRAWPLTSVRRFFEEDLGIPLARKRRAASSFLLRTKRKMSSMHCWRRSTGAARSSGWASE